MKKSNILKKFTSYILSLSTISIPLCCQPFFANATGFHSQSAMQTETNHRNAHGMIHTLMKTLLRKYAKLKQLILNFETMNIPPTQPTEVVSGNQLPGLCRPIISNMLSLLGDIQILDKLLSDTITNLQQDNRYALLDENLKAEIDQLQHLNQQIFVSLPKILINISSWGSHSQE